MTLRTKIILLRLKAGMYRRQTRMMIEEIEHALALTAQMLDNTDN